VTTYARLLRLRHLALSGGQGEVLSWGVGVAAVLLALTGLVSPWGILLLPLAVAAVVKSHDSLTEWLPGAATVLAPNSSEPPVTGTGGSAGSA
jgi:hypothetical protein